LFEDGSYFQEIWITLDRAATPLLQLRQSDRFIFMMFRQRYP